MTEKRRTFDVDIDVASKTAKDPYGIRAMVSKNDSITAHPSGYYMEDVPVDTITGLCAFDSEYGDSVGFQKVDLLSNTTYDMFKSKDDVLSCMEEPSWDLFLEEDIVEKLPHLSKHYDLLVRIRPKSIDDLADILALIRPAKMHMVDDYVKNRKKTRRNLYKRSKGHYFKKAHAYSYAMMIICVVNKLSESRIIF